MDETATTPPLHPTDLAPPDVPEVDVVILSWNRQDDTFAAIGSVLDQVGVRTRLWVVDQGSEPDQVEALRRLAHGDGRVELIELGRNVGVPAGRNAGIRLGSAAWIVSLDNDAVLGSPRTVADAVERLASSPAVGAVAFRADDHAGGGLDQTSWAYPAALTDQSEPVPVARFVGVGHAMRRSAFEVVGGYDEGLFFCEEELDLSYRLIAHGYRIVYDPAVVVRHKVSPEGRVGWDGGRLFYQVRNAVLVHHRHRRHLPSTVAVAGAWLARATYNRRPGPALRGIREAVRALRHERPRPAMSRSTRRYLWEHDTRLRGPLLGRLRSEVLAPLPFPSTGGGRG